MSTDSLRTRALEALTDLAAFTALRIEEAGDKIPQDHRWALERLALIRVALEALPRTATDELSSMARVGSRASGEGTSVGTEYPKEQARCREMLDRYRAIGPPGLFAATMLGVVLGEADEAATSGDVVRQLRAFQAMKEFTE